MAQPERDAEKLTDEVEKESQKLERETDKLAHRNQDLGEEVSDARSDWESKRSDPGVPGALEPTDDEERESSGDDADRDENTRDSG